MLMLMGLSRFLLLRRLDQRPPRNDGKTIERGVAFPGAQQELLRHSLSQLVIAAVEKLTASVFECHVHPGSRSFVQPCHARSLQPRGARTSKISSRPWAEN